MSTDETVGRTTTHIPGSTTACPSEWARDMAARFDRGGNASMAETMYDVSKRIDEARETGVGRYYELRRERDALHTQRANFGKALGVVYRTVLGPHCPTAFPVPKEFLDDEMSEEDLAALLDGFERSLIAALDHVSSYRYAVAPSVDDEPPAHLGEREHPPLSAIHGDDAPVDDEPTEAYDDTPVATHRHPVVTKGYEEHALKMLEAMYEKRPTRKSIEVSARRAAKLAPLDLTDKVVVVEKGWLSRVLTQFEALTRGRGSLVCFDVKGERVDARIAAYAPGTSVTVGYIPSHPADVSTSSVIVKFFDIEKMREAIKPYSAKHPIAIGLRDGVVHFIDGTSVDCSC